jgi:hypothetical protein
VLNRGVTKVHYIFQPDHELRQLAGDTKEAVPFQYQMIDHVESANRRKQDRLDTFKKQDTMAGSKIRNLGSTQRRVGAQQVSIIDTDWQYSEKMTLQGGQRIFIQSYQSSPLDLYVSALNERLKKQKKEEAKQSEEEKDELEMLIENGLAQQNEKLPDADGDDILGIFAARDQRFARRFLYFNTFEDMHFVMNGLAVSNLFGQRDEVVTQLLTFHRETLKYNALTLLGSSNLIGNPSRYVSNIGSGVSDFFVKPYQGMKNGGVALAADGFAKGSKSLFKNGLLAPVGAISKLGTSVSRGTLALSFDDQFIEEKMHKDKVNAPKSFGDGLRKGFASAGTSIWSGVSGIVTKPVEGARRDGLEGFFLGVGKGATGLVAKTLSGTIDIVAKTSEGIDYQAKSSIQLSIRVRMRSPRPFYESNALLRPYNALHANWLLCIPQLHKEVNLPTFFDLVCLPEEHISVEQQSAPSTKTPSASSNAKKYGVHRCHVFAISRNVIIHVVNTVRLPHRADLDIERDFMPLSRNPDIQARISSWEGTGSRITLEGMYSLRHLEFVDLLEEKSLNLGFAYNQKENYTKQPYKNGDITYQVFLDSEGYNNKLSGTPAKGNQIKSQPIKNKQT